MRRMIPFVAMALLLAPVGASAQDDLDPGRVMERLIDRYSTDRNAVSRFYDVPVSLSRIDRLERQTNAWLDRLSNVDFDALDQDGRVDYVLLRSLLDRRRLGAAFQRKKVEETLEVVPFATGIVELEEARRRLEPLAARDAASRLAEINKAVGDLKKRVEKGLAKNAPEDAFKPSAVVANRAARHLGSLRRTLKSWYEYRNGFEPDFGWWVRKPFAALDSSLHEYGKVLKEKVAKVKGNDPPLIGDPIGRDELNASLAVEFLPYSPEELIAMAEKEFAWCEAEGLKAAKELGHEGDWKAAVEKVKGMHAEPGGQTAIVEQQARDAIKFVEDRKLLTVPDLAKETWRLEMISAKRQKTTPFALYGGQSMLVAYATDGMTHESKLMSMRGNNEHFTRIVTPHELIPGHHLQMFMAARYRTHRSLFRTPFLVEGWALHWELLLWDLGWQRNAADRVGMLFWRMHRCARVIISLKFHLGEMTPDEMVSFLTDRVGLERDGARAEVRRYVGESYGPLYQCAYLIGGLQIRAMRKELVESGRMTDRAFHDAILRENAIPIELIRAKLTNAPLTRDAKSTWKF